MPIKRHDDGRAATLDHILEELRVQTEELHRIAAEVRAESRRHIAKTRKDLKALRGRRVGKKR